MIIDMKGEISSTLPHSNEQTNELGVLISNILQDINSYMRANQGQCGQLHKTTLRLGASHEVRIVVGSDRIKAVVREIGGGAVATGGVAEGNTAEVGAAGGDQGNE